MSAQAQIQPDAVGSSFQQALASQPRYLSRTLRKGARLSFWTAARALWQRRLRVAFPERGATCTRCIFPKGLQFILDRSPSHLGPRACWQQAAATSPAKARRGVSTQASALPSKHAISFLNNIFISTKFPKNKLATITASSSVHDGSKTRRVGPGDWRMVSF